MLRKLLIQILFTVSAIVVCEAQRPDTSIAALRLQLTDSVGSGALHNAFVVVQGTNRTGTVDDIGRADIDSIPNGAHSLEIFHPWLDSVGIRLTVPSTRFRGGDTVHLSVAIPSPVAIARMKCPALHSADEGALIGFVTESDGMQPVPAAHVVVLWTETEIGKAVGVRATRLQRTADAGPDGRFIVCNLPAEFSGQIFATTGARTTNSIPIAFTQTHLAIQSVAFSDNSDAQLSVSAENGGRNTGRVGSATVKGTVRDRGGKPIRGAAVGITGALNSTRSDSSGVFTLNNAPSGSQTLQIRKLGFEAVERSLILPPNQVREVAVVMESFTPILSTVIVKATRDAALEKIGFTKRKNTGFGYYVAPEEIDRMNPLRVSDFLRGIPSLSVTYESNRARVTGRSAGLTTVCVTYVVDGMPVTGEIDEVLQPQEVGAIEAYTSTRAPNDIPGAFSMQNCQVVVIWTKMRLESR
jgi:hypothetical protein